MKTTEIFAQIITIKRGNCSVNGNPSYTTKVLNIETGETLNLVSRDSYSLCNARPDDYLFLEYSLSRKYGLDGNIQTACIEREAGPFYYQKLVKLNEIKNKIQAMNERDILIETIESNKKNKTQKTISI